jgi:hypothetical protein
MTKFVSQVRVCVGSWRAQIQKFKNDAEKQQKVLKRLHEQNVRLTFLHLFSSS